MKMHSYPDQNAQTITEQPESDSKNYRENKKPLNWVDTFAGDIISRILK